MSDDSSSLNSLLSTASAGGAEDREALVAALTTMPEGETRKALEEFAAKHGALAPPLLEQLAVDAAELPAALAVEILGAISNGESASALSRIAAAAPHAGIRKAARRALHRLASKGVVPAIPEAAASEARLPKATPVYKAIASPIDGAGNRGIWFAFDRGGELDVVSLLLSDEQGVKDAFVRDFSVDRFDRESKKLLEDREFPWIEMPADYCGYLVEVAHRRNASTGTALPVQFLAWRDRISGETSFDQPIIYTVMSAAEVRWDPRHLDSSGSLFDLDLFKGWILDRDELGEFVQQRLSVERSGLVLAGSSRENRNRMIDDRAIQRLFTAERRALYKGRLEEMSYLLWKLGRVEAARQALAAALALEPADRSLSGNPFVVALVEWSLEVVTEMARGEKTRSIRPGVQLHLPY